MNIVLWVLQILLALHTGVGALWKFSHTPAETMPSLALIEPSVWIVLAIVELLCAVALVVPGVTKRFTQLIPIAAAIIGLEMLMFCVLHFFSGDRSIQPIIYWLITAGICAFVVYGRMARRRIY
ncbi:DoxX family protein [Bdellovibrio sp. HCB274]|uniref:DoxX family protein n=1 Tax=Bdellovibrio sp. HCB274 TaxID=3394361 RepID=UPI0039B60EAC